MSLVEILFAREILAVTSFSSIIALIFIVNYLFESSTNPSILSGFLGWPPQSGANRVFFDYVIIGLGGGLVWLLLFMSLVDFFRKAREISLHQALLRSGKTFSAGIFQIVDTFDRHPWLVTLLIGIITLLVGILIGSWAR